MSKPTKYFYNNIGVIGIVANGSPGTDGQALLSNGSATFWGSGVGAQGPQGFQGFQGVQGTIGPQGTQGFQGVQGAVGAQGSQGFQGVVGAQGSQGFQGDTGPQGATGAQGVVGAQGSQGFQGVQGATGAQGVVGAQGATGVQGVQGAQGRQGVQGTLGAQGSTGADSTVPGPTGPQGVQGLAGPTGPQGVQGAQGRQGVVGAQGAVGAQGVIGTTGPTGPQGVQGTAGATGPTGPQGVQGTAGATGPTGPQGVQGAAGPTGLTSGDQTITGVKTFSSDVAAGANPVILRNSNIGNNTTKSSSALFQGTDTVGTVKNIGSVGFFPDDSNYIGANLRFLVRSGDTAPVERMRIDSSGNVGIGVSSPGVKLQVHGPNLGTTAGNESIVSSFLANDGNDTALRLLNRRVANGSSHTTSELRIQRRVDVTDFGYVGFQSGAITFGTGASTERMRITSAGNVTANVDFRAPIFFDSNNTAFFVDPAGTSNINGLNGNGKNALRTSDSFLRINEDSAFTNGSWFGGSLVRADGFYTGSNGGTTSSRVVITGGTFNGSAAINLNGSAGTIITLGDITAFGTPSDIRLKEHIENIPNALEKLLTLNGVNFNYKKDGKRSTGVIAQEVEKVLPEVIYETTDPDGIETFKAVRYGNMVGLLIEAIKEQQLTINALVSKVEQLESSVFTDYK